MIVRIEDFIYKKRIDKRIKASTLSRGILSNSSFSKFEHGTLRIDKNTVEALFQRLGYGFDKLEFQVSYTDYRKLIIQRLWINSLFSKNISDFSHYEKLYNSVSLDASALDRQFCYILKSLGSYVLLEESPVKALGYIETALSCTKASISSGFIHQNRLCIQEIQCILYWCIFTSSRPHNDDQRLSLLEELEWYSDSQFSDIEEKNRIYPYVCFLLTREYDKRNNEKSAIKICRKAIHSIRKNGSIKMLTYFSQYLITHSNDNSEKKTLSDITDSVLFVYNYFNIRIPEQSVADLVIGILTTSSQDEIYINSEIIKNTRSAFHISQEELSWEICSQESLSRIESNLRSPQRQTLSKLYKKLGFNDNMFCGYIVTSDYNDILCVRHLHRLWYQGKIKESERILLHLETRLDTNETLNRQYLQLQHLMISGETKKITIDEEIEHEQSLLELTMPDFMSKGIYRVPSRVEYDILSRIFQLLKRQRKYFEADNLLKSILHAYQQEDPNEVFHSREMKSIYFGYAALLECMNQLDKSIECSTKLIPILTFEDRGDILAQALGNLSCVFIKKGTPHDLDVGRKFLVTDILLMPFYYHEKDYDMALSYYNQVFGDDTNL